MPAPAAETELADAEKFLKPVLHPRPKIEDSGPVSVAEVLRNESGRDVPERTLEVLSAIYERVSQSSDPESEAEALLETSDRRRILDCLLDLASIEGIYPYLRPGVGVPIQNRMRSSLQKYVVSVERSLDVLPRNAQIDKTINVLLTFTTDSVLATVLYDRIIVDLLAIMIQYSSDPDNRDTVMTTRLDQLLHRIPLSYLLPSLSALAHPAAPDWMRSSVKSCLESLPLRHNGIRETIQFLAVTQRSAQTSDLRPSQGPILTHELLTQLATIVCVVPFHIDPDHWYQNISEQLLSLIDSADVDDQRVAAFAIGAILGQQKLGAPGTPGWKYAAEPMVSVLNGQAFDLTSTKTRDYSPISAQILRAAERLERLLTVHPNPGLVKRLASRVVPTLWILACGPRNQVSLGSKAAANVLQIYLREAGPQAILRLLEQIDRDGPVACRISWQRGEQWMVIPLLRTKSKEPSGDVVKEVADLSTRVDILVDIIEAVRAEDLSELCLKAVQRWFDNSRPEPAKKLDTVQHGMVHGSFLYLRFLQSLIEKYQQKLATSPEHFVPLIIEIITSFLNEQRANHPDRISLENLTTIAKPQQPLADTSDGAESMVGISLGLLSILLMDEARFMSSTERPALLSLRTALNQLSVRTDLSVDLTFPARSLLVQLSDAMGIGVTQSSTIKQPSKQEDDLTNHRSALEKIAQPEPPIRAEGLADLNKLISRSSKVISVPPTVILLVSLLKEADEYTNLGAIKTIRLLGSQRPGPTLDHLFSYFVDTNEDSSLDLRLKVAESIQQIIAALGTHLGSNLAVKAADNLIFVAGRRPQRPQEGRRRTREMEHEGRKRKSAGSFSVSLSVPQLDVDDREEVTPSDELAARLLEKWAGTGREEDIRVRASALSILNAVLQTGELPMDQTRLEALFDLILSILRLERDEGEAILRRSAVLCLQTLVTAADAGSLAKQDGTALNGILLENAMAMLEDMSKNEPDDIARGHAVTVKEMLEDIQREALELKLRGDDIRFDLGGQLRGLDVNPEAPSDRKPKIEEIE